jgi:two-component system chemotaxis response regulator CheB
MKPRKGKKILVIEDESELAEILQQFLKVEFGHAEIAQNFQQAKRVLEIEQFDVVVSDIVLPDGDGLSLLAELKRQNIPIPQFIFVTGYRDAEITERSNRLGAVDILTKPVEQDDLIEAIYRALKRQSDYIQDVMDSIQIMSGIRLGADKRFLVETRIHRRARELGFSDLKAYESFFRVNRQNEIYKLLSHLTTHHTYFFRESEHFDYLFDEVFPRIIKENRTIRIWSAACSTGEEAFSIAMAFLNFVQEHPEDVGEHSKIQILGTDIDEAVVETAKMGIYPAKALENLNSSMAKAYFDKGSKEISHLVKIKDEVLNLCRFEKRNLLASDKDPSLFDVIFVRNVLIYFTPDTIEDIIHNLAQSLRADGCLILGHSESLMGLNTNLVPLKNSIYQLPQSQHSPSAPDSRPRIQPEKRAKVFIIDDSATVRTLIKKIIAQDKRLEFVGEAENPIDAAAKMRFAKPDVLALDIHMPKMDGIQYLQSIQGQDHPAVVMISSVSKKDAESAMSCFELGASAYIEKPSGLDLTSKAEEIATTLISCSATRFAGRSMTGKRPLESLPAYHPGKNSHNLIVIGASTGGIDAIRQLLSRFPNQSPPILIVQHIPANFSYTFAQRLEATCRIKVKEASDGEIAQENQAYIAPGGLQMGVQKSPQGIRLRITNDERVNRHKPSVDYLFMSLAKIADEFNIAAALLTGMGADGAEGLLALKKAGAHTITQDEESSVVYGMPKVAHELGADREVLPLTSIAYHLFKALEHPKPRKRSSA